MLYDEILHPHFHRPCPHRRRRPSGSRRGDHPRPVRGRLTRGRLQAGALTDASRQPGEHRLDGAVSLLGAGGGAAIGGDRRPLDRVPGRHAPSTARSSSPWGFPAPTRLPWSPPMRPCASPRTCSSRSCCATWRAWAPGAWSSGRSSSRSSRPGTACGRSCATGRGERMVEAAYLIGADGVRSRVREELGIRRAARGRFATPSQRWSTFLSTSSWERAAATRSTRSLTPTPPTARS